MLDLEASLTCYVCDIVRALALSFEIDAFIAASLFQSSGSHQEDFLDQLNSTDHAKITFAYAFLYFDPNFFVDGLLYLSNNLFVPKLQRLDS